MTTAYLAELRAEYRLREQDRKKLEQKHKAKSAAASVKGRTARSR